MKKILLTTTLMAVFAATMVYAYIFDTDGGFNVWEQGTCMDVSGNHTDSCILFGSSKNQLREWYPVNNTNVSACYSAVVNCADFNATCENGACVSR